MGSTTRRIALTGLLLALAAGAGVAEDAEDTGAPNEPVRLVTSFDVSPDGTWMVLAWHGDLWRASVEGGTLVRLTRHPAGDTQPRISPDGRQVAWVSSREGSDHVYVMSLEGGTPRRITSHTEGFRLHDWYPEGDAVLVRTRFDRHWRNAYRFYRRPLDADAPLEMLIDATGGSAALSPDASHLAFTREGVGWARKGYAGSQAAQVWVADLAGPSYRKLTRHERGDRWPLWTPDGKRLWVTSQEDGTWNLYRVDLATGARTQRTRFEDDGVLFPRISRDGKRIVFLRRFELWSLDTEGETDAVRIPLRDDGDPMVDRVLRRTLTKADAVAFSDDGREIAFTAGGDVWVMDTELREPRQVTNTPEDERDPVFAPDFGGLYFVSDAEEGPDIWRATRADDTRWWWQNDAFELTRITHDAAAEAWPWFTPDGKRLAFVKGGGDLWTMKPDGSDPVRLVASWNPPSYDFSPDGQWLAYAVSDENANRDVWIRRVDGSGEPFNVSRHPDHDSSPRFSPDGKVLVFTSRRWRDEQDICYVWLRKEAAEIDERDRKVDRAERAMEGRRGGRRTPTAPAAPPAVAPVVGRWQGRLDGPPPLPPGGLPFSLAFRTTDDGLAAVLHVPGWFEGPLDAVQVAVDSGEVHLAVSSASLGAVEAVGTLAGDRLDGTWQADGPVEGTFALERVEAAAAPAAPTSGGSGGGAPKVVVEIDFDGLRERIRRVSIPDTAERSLMWSPDSKKLAFQATVKGEVGMYTIDFPSPSSPRKLSSTTGTWGRWIAQGNRIVWLVKGVPGALTAAGKTSAWPFSVRQEVDLAARHGAAFDAVWRVMRDTYYDPRLNNLDWDALRETYRPVAAATLDPAQLERVVNMLLGELNGSHLGFSGRTSSWRAPGWRDETAHLGVRFADRWPGPGLRVRDVVPGTPAHAERSRILPGELLRAVDGVEVGPDTNLPRLLTGPAAREIELRVEGLDGVERAVRLRPTSYRDVRAKLYDLWLAERRAMVAAASDDRLGYLHVRGMNWSSFERFEEALYDAGHGKDGLIIDVRDNGGGFTADHLLTCLSQPLHALTVSRGATPGYPQDRMVYARWTQPVVVLCNQNSFSNAEIFAHAIRTLERGQVVGVPTAGGVISTGGIQIMDVGSLRLPGRGWFRLPDGEDMERSGCVPHHIVWPQPADEASGVDRQLDKAVEVLREDVRAAARRPAFRPRYASERDAAPGR